MHSLGRILMTLAILGHTVVPPAVDLLTDTHVFNPTWPPHARFHTVWLIGATSSVGVLALGLLWGRFGEGRLQLNLAGALSAIVYGSFYLSAMTLGAYGGTLADQAGVVPGPFGIDANLFVFTIWSIVLAVGWRLASGEQEGSPD